MDSGRQTSRQAELLPVWVAKVLCKSRLRGRRLGGARVVVFVDNVSARYALIKRFSPAHSSSELVAASATADVRLGIVPVDRKRLCQAGFGLSCVPSPLGRNWRDLTIALDRVWRGVVA